jgi:hypothetical protein
MSLSDGKLADIDQELRSFGLSLNRYEPSECGKVVEWRAYRDREIMLSVTLVVAERSEADVRLYTDGGLICRASLWLEDWPGIRSVVEAVNQQMMHKVCWGQNNLSDDLPAWAKGLGAGWCNSTIVF